jgi:hypothetical protein
MAGQAAAAELVPRLDRGADGAARLRRDTGALLPYADAQAMNLRLEKISRR